MKHLYYINLATAQAQAMRFKLHYTTAQALLTLYFVASCERKCISVQIRRACLFTVLKDQATTHKNRVIDNFIKISDL
jgi:hypothetical protein